MGLPTGGEMAELLVSSLAACALLDWSPQEGAATAKIDEDRFDELLTASDRYELGLRMTPDCKKRHIGC